MDEVYFTTNGELTKIATGNAYELQQKLPEVITKIRPSTMESGKKLEEQLRTYYNEYEQEERWYNLPHKEAAGFILYDWIDCEVLECIIEQSHGDNRDIPLTRKLAKNEGIW